MSFSRLIYMINLYYAFMFKLLKLQPVVKIELYTNDSKDNCRNIRIAMRMHRAESSLFPGEIRLRSASC